MPANDRPRKPTGRRRGHGTGREGDTHASPDTQPDRGTQSGANAHASPVTRSGPGPKPGRGTRPGVNPGPSLSHGHGHGHGHGPAEPVSRRVRTLLTVLLTPLALAAVLGAILLYPFGSQQATGGDLGLHRTPVHAEVTAVAQEPCAAGGPAENCQIVMVKLTDGPGSGATVRVQVPLGPSAPRFTIGDAVVLAYSGEGNPREGASYELVDFQRGLPLGVLAAIFALAVLVLARWRGLAALGALVLSFLILMYFMLPAILAGKSPLAVAVVGAGIIMFLALYLTHGFSARTSTAVLGTLASLLLIGFLGAAFVGLNHLTGLDEDTTNLITLLGRPVDTRGLLLAGIIIGALGVLDDVTVTQASAVWELRRANPSLNWRQLYAAGLRIGRDHAGSAVNTLFMAYAGAALPMLITFSVSGRTFTELATTQTLAQEIVRTLVGSIGLVAAVPVTTLLAALVAVREPAAEQAAHTPEPDAVPATEDPADSRPQPQPPAAVGATSAEPDPAATTGPTTAGGRASATASNPRLRAPSAPQRSAPELGTAHSGVFPPGHPSAPGIRRPGGPPHPGERSSPALNPGSGQWPAPAPPQGSGQWPDPARSPRSDQEAASTSPQGSGQWPAPAPGSGHWPVPSPDPTHPAGPGNSSAVNPAASHPGHPGHSGDFRRPVPPRPEPADPTGYQPAPEHMANPGQWQSPPPSHDTGHWAPLEHPGGTGRWPLPEPGPHPEPGARRPPPPPSQQWGSPQPGQPDPDHPEPTHRSRHRRD